MGYWRRGCKGSRGAAEEGDVGARERGGVGVHTGLGVVLGVEGGGG